MNIIIKLFIRYGFYGFCRLVLQTIISKLLFPKVRLIRYPFYIRGKKSLKIDKGFTSGVGLRIDCFPINNNEICVEIGFNVEVGDYVHIGSVNSVTIGNNVLIASKVYISDHDHGSYGLNDIHTNPSIHPNDRPIIYDNVVIEDDVWIGESVSILKGVTIGKGSVIGASSVVNNSIPPYVIAAGIPAKIIKKYNFETNMWEKCK